MYVELTISMKEPLNSDKLSFLKDIHDGNPLIVLATGLDDDERINNIFFDPNMLSVEFEADASEMPFEAMHKSILRGGLWSEVNIYCKYVTEVFSDGEWLYHAGICLIGSDHFVYTKSALPTLEDMATLTFKDVRLALEEAHKDIKDINCAHDFYYDLCHYVMRMLSDEGC